MSKEYYVLRGGRVVYSPGHYDLAGAEAVKDSILKQHPKAVVTIVKIVSTWIKPGKTNG